MHVRIYVYTYVRMYVSNGHTARGQDDVLRAERTNPLGHEALDVKSDAYRRIVGDVFVADV